MYKWTKLLFIITINNERYFLPQSQWCARTGFSSSMIFPSTKHQIAMAASSTWQALVPHHPTGILLVHPPLDRTVRTQPDQHPNQHFQGWDCGQEENPKPGAEYAPWFTWLIAQCCAFLSFLWSLLFLGMGAGYFRNFWVGMCHWDRGTLSLHQS